MGAYQSKRRHFPAPRKRKIKVKKPIYDYMPGTVRRRPKSSTSWRDVHIATLGQMGRSSTTYEDEDITLKQVQNIPKWQSKWEVDMRPEPTSENKPNIHDGTLLPVTYNSNSDNNANTSAAIPKHSLGKKSKQQLPRTRRYEHRNSTPSLPDVEENDNFERYSWKSSKVDGLKMLHKTDNKTLCAFQQASHIWQLDHKRINKSWFLGQDSQTKLDNQIVETKTRTPKPQKVFVAVRSKGRWAKDNK